MEKPYRPDYRPNYDKWERICRAERKERIECSLMSCVIWVNIIVVAKLWLDNDLSRYNFAAFLIVCFPAFCSFIALKIISMISLLIFPIDKKARQCAENEAENAYNADMARYTHGLKAEDERYERQVMREIKGMRMRGEIENKIALRRYSYLQTIQNSQNQQLIKVLNRAIQASNSGNYTDLSNNLKQLERELGL